MKPLLFHLLLIFALIIPLFFTGTSLGGEEETESKDKTPEKATEETQEVAVIETKFGKIVLVFFPEDAPNHVANFKKLASEGFYNGTTFHRVVPERVDPYTGKKIPPFVIQGGDPNTKDDERSNDGMGGPGYTIDAEFNSRKHLRGTLSMARSNDPNSAGSQFFICLSPLPSLDGKYTVFGKVIEGMDVVDKIAHVERDERDNPIEPVVMEKVYIEERNK